MYLLLPFQPFILWVEMKLLLSLQRPVHLRRNPHGGPRMPPIGHTTLASNFMQSSISITHDYNLTEFAFEIGSSLLTEVRRLQSLIGERDKAIQDLNEENQDLRQAVEDLKSGLETQKSTAG